MLKTRHIEKGDWRTLEWFWNANGTAFFRQPADARIKVRYGFGFFGTNGQEQMLDGSNYKKLVVGGASITRARMQIKVPRSTDIRYEVHGGGVSFDAPEIPF